VNVEVELHAVQRGDVRHYGIVNLGEFQRLHAFTNLSLVAETLPIHSLQSLFVQNNFFYHSKLESLDFRVLRVKSFE